MSDLDGSLVYLIILNRSVSAAEVEKVTRWSDSIHVLGSASNHFAIGIWNSFSFTTQNQHHYNIIWRVPLNHMPARSRTVSFLLRLPVASSSSRNLLHFSAPAAFSSRRFGIDWIYNSSETSQLRFYDAADSTNVNGSLCSIAETKSMKVDIIISPQSSGHGSDFVIHINHVLRTDCVFSTSWSSTSYPGDVLTRQSNRFEIGDDAQFQHLRVLSYAASASDLTRPHLLSIVVSNSTSLFTSAIIIGCCFTGGLPCQLLANGVPVSMSCSILNALEASVVFLSNIQLTSVALTHNGQVFVLEVE
jgi:hypothetical protein